MKNKLLTFLILFFLIPLTAFAEKDTVTFSKCVDGDTAKFMMKKKEITVRFLAVDTPETKHPTKGEEPFGKEASEYTCNKIKNAKKIELEYDENSDKQDKYDRYLAWIWVDGELLQDELIQNGLAEVAYLYGDYKYTPLLKDHENLVKINKIGKWQENKDEKKELSTMDWIFIIIVIIVFLSLFIFSPKFRKKNINKAKRKIKKEFKNDIEKILK